MGSATNPLTSVILYRFGPFEFRPGEFDLRRRTILVRLARQSLQILSILLENAGKIVTRDQLRQALWPDDVHVDFDTALNTAVKRLRQALEDTAEKERYIETVPRIGYRFAAPVEVVRSEPEPDTSAMFTPLPSAPVSASVALAAETVGHQRASRRWVWLVVAILAALSTTFALFGLLSPHAKSDVPVEESWPFHQVTTTDPEDHVTASSISPDGKLLAYASSAGVMVEAIAANTEHRLQSPSDFRVDRIAWFSDDLRLAVSGYTASSFQPQIWIASLTGDPPRLVQDGARNGVPDPTGKYFAFSAGHDSELWVAGPEGEDPKRLLAEPGSTYPYIIWSFDGQRLTYQREQNAPSSLGSAVPPAGFARWHYGSVSILSGKIVSDIPNVRMSSASALPDGKLIFSQVSPSEPSLDHALWQVQTNASSGNFQSPPVVIKKFPGKGLSSVSAASDGKAVSILLAYGHTAVYAAELRHPGSESVPVGLAQVRRMTYDNVSDYPQAWTPDSKSVIFESNITGRFELYKQDLNEHNPKMLAWMSGGAVLPQLAVGKWILFAGETAAARGPGQSTSYLLFRVPVGGGDVQKVNTGGFLDEFRCASSRNASCVLRETVGHEEFVYYALDPLTGKGRELGRTAWSPTMLHDWDISPDGSTVAIAIHDQARPRIRIVPLAAFLPKAHESEISLPGFMQLNDAVWTTDATGFYAEAQTSLEVDLLYVDLHGHTTVLRDSALYIWGVPSPDGTKLAFVDQSVDSNVWIRQ